MSEAAEEILDSAVLIYRDTLAQKRVRLLFEPICVAGVKVTVKGDNPMPGHLGQFGCLDIRQDVCDMKRHQILGCCNRLVSRDKS